MAPRPDYEKLGFYSASDEECAKLVKPGQLNTFK
jgi:hypothetical protein